MLFDLETHGHHANYIRHLINYWALTIHEHQLTVVVSPDFISKHKEVIALTQKGGTYSSIRFQPISQNEANSLQGDSRIVRAFRRLKEWQLLCRYARIIRASHCLIMFIDKLQLPIILNLKPPCKFSGIYFQPSFHYKDLLKHFRDDSIDEKRYPKTSFKSFKDLLFLFQLSRNPEFNYLFSLDPYAVNYIQRRFKQINCIPLPDPVETLTETGLGEEMPEIIEDGRVGFLVFGYLNHRKGIYKLIEALKQLPIEFTQKIALIFVGQLDPSLQNDLPQQLDDLISTHAIQVTTNFGFVSDQQVEQYFKLADVVLAIYQNHIGMSGILLLSALAKKPVLCQEYGLMGRVTHEFELGLTVDSTNACEIAEKIKLILSSPREELGCQQGRERFVESNLSHKFSETLLESLTASD